MRYALILLPLLCVSACAGDLPEPSLIDKLRVLGIRADLPEVQPGATVTLDALVVEPQGGQISYEWTACFITERGSNFFGSAGAPTGQSGGKGYALNEPGSCKSHVEAGAPFALDLGTDATATLTIDPNFLTPQNVARAYGIPNNTIPEAVLSLISNIAGVNMTVTLIVTAGDERVEAFKRINVSLADQPNTNPDNMAFHIAAANNPAEPPKTATPPANGRCFAGEDQGLVVLTKGDQTITALNIPDPQEEYLVLLGDPKTPIQSHKESFFYSYFSTRGRFGDTIVKSSEDGQVEWSLSDDELGGIPIWIVVRDGRGGTNWCHSTL